MHDEQRIEQIDPSLPRRNESIASRIVGSYLLQVVVCTELRPVADEEDRLPRPPADKNRSRRQQSKVTLFWSNDGFHLVTLRCRFGYCLGLKVSLHASILDMTSVLFGCSS